MLKSIVLSAMLQRDAALDATICEIRLQQQSTCGALAMFGMGKAPVATTAHR